MLRHDGEDQSRKFGESFWEKSKSCFEETRKRNHERRNSKKTGNAVGVNNVSFEVTEGEIFVIMGLSGSGKSTLIRCLNLLNKPTAGKIFFEGEDIVKYNKKL